MEQKTLFEGIKCLTRRYTILALFMLAVLINVLFYIAEYVLENSGYSFSLWHHQIILGVVTIIVVVGVVSIFLINLDAIRDEMVANLKKLIAIIRNQTPQDFAKKIEIDEVSCDDEVFEIVSVLNSRSEQIAQYINHLKYVIGYIQHEFNTPLATLALGIERLKKQHPDVDIAPLQEEIHDLSKILNSLSFLSSRDKKNIEFADVEVLSVIKKTVSLLNKVYPDSDIQYHGDASMVLHTNVIYLHIIMKNIIENACKYSGEKQKIDIALQGTEKRIVIQDYGQGMSEDELKSIGLPFWQGDTSRGKDSGLGLGLTLVYELAEVLDIKVDVSSEKNKGTIFTLSFLQ